MKKEINKKVLVLSLVLFSIILISLVGVSAISYSNTGDTPPGDIGSPADTGLPPVGASTPASGSASITGQTNFDKLIQVVSQKLSESGFNFGLTKENTTPWFLGVLLWIILYTILVKTGLFSKNAGEMGIGAAVIALIITIITYLYTPPELWTTIAIQQAALGAAMIVMIPFLIITYFTVAASPSLLLSRTVWAIYIVYYFILALYKLGFSTKAWSSADNLPYVLAVVAGIIIFGSMAVIRKFFWNEALNAQMESGVRGNQEARVGRNILENAAQTLGRT